MDTRCKATTTAGSSCMAQPVRPSGYCAWHDPSLEADRQANRRKGGHARSNRERAKRRLPADAMTVDDVRGVLGQAIRATLAGDLEPGVANAVANLSRVALAAAETAALAEIERRVADIEALAAREPA